MIGVSFGVNFLRRWLGRLLGLVVFDVFSDDKEWVILVIEIKRFLCIGCGLGWIMGIKLLVRFIK